MPRPVHGIALTVLLAATAGTALPAGPAVAAPRKPLKTLATTGDASGILPTAATVGARVRPGGRATTFQFQFGTTRRYDSSTPAFDAGSGRKTRSVKAALLGLAPATTYHYRVVARTAKGTVRGEDKTLTTRKQPLGLVLSASPNPASVTSGLTLAGQLSGTDNDNRRLTLQAKPFPYTTGWSAIPGVNDVVTAPGTGGAFAFRLPPIPFNTQFRVVVAGKPEIASPIIAVGVKPRIGTTAPRRVTRTRGRKARIALRGSITPNRDGSQVLVQKRVRGVWRTVGTTVARRVSDTESRYAKTVRQRHGGTYRVVVNPVDGAFAPNHGREVRVQVRTRR